MKKVQKFTIFNLVFSSTALIIQLPKLFTSNISIHLVLTILVVVLSCFLAASYFCRIMVIRKGSRYYDERDKLIHKNAAFAGFVTSFFVFFLAIMLTCFIFGKDNSISIPSLLGIFLLCATSMFFAESLSLLIQYNKEGEYGQ